MGMSEVLHDHFLNVPILLVQCTNREQGIESLLEGLTNPDQDSGRKCHGKFSRFLDRAQAQCRNFVGSFEMRQAFAHQPGTDCFEHQTHADVRFPEALQRRAIHHAGIRMRQQTRAFQHHFGHRRCVIQRARKALPPQKLARFGKNTFRLIAQAKKRLFATGCAALFSNREDLIRCHEMRAGLAGILAEGAVAAVIAAQRGQGNENFFGEGDDSSLPLSAE